ncbi:MAG: hypothetical protein R3B90_05010 [Planctomycetaceae bacterium]
MVVEAGPNTADIWTKPGGLEFNADNPIEALGDIGESFLAVFMDGSAQSIPADVDATTLKNLLQHSDGTPVQRP